ncbi:MAG: hypothetical protein RLZZ546_2392 [Bacteroidota bacterium]|jgi:hypothetical protein
MSKLFSLILVIFTIWSCKTKKQVIVDKSIDYKYGYDRGACFGKCPIYNIRITEEGNAIWDAKKWNKVNGRFEKKLTKAQFDKIKSVFNKANLFSLKDEYETMVADLPISTLHESKNGKLKRVRGNEKMPESFEAAVDAMNELVRDEAGWQIIEKYEQDTMDDEREKSKESNTIFDEIIIEPNPGIRLNQWFKDNENLTIRLIKRISPDLNLWLITYDVNKFSPQEMLENLKRDAAIKTAEFNKKISNR